MVAGDHLDGDSGVVAGGDRGCGGGARRVEHGLQPGQEELRSESVLAEMSGIDLIRAVERHHRGGQHPQPMPGQFVGSVEHRGAVQGSVGAIGVHVAAAQLEDAFDRALHEHHLRLPRPRRRPSRRAVSWWSVAMYWRSEPNAIVATRGS